MQWLNREPGHLKGNRLFPRMDGEEAGQSGAMVPQTWAGKAAEEKVYVLRASCAFPLKVGSLLHKPLFSPH